MPEWFWALVVVLAFWLLDDLVEAWRSRSRGGGE